MGVKLCLQFKHTHVRTHGLWHVGKPYDNNSRILCVLWVHVCMCVCLSVFTHTEVQLTNITRASEARPVLHMTNFNHNTIVAVIFLLLQGPSAVKKSSLPSHSLL